MDGNVEKKVRNRKDKSRRGKERKYLMVNVNKNSKS